MASYRDIFGNPDPNGSGLLAPFLGDPRKFKRPFDDHGYYWIATHGDGGAWLILGADGQGNSVYDFHKILHEDASGSQGAAAIFRQVEADISASLGLDQNLSQAIDYPADVDGNDPTHLAILPAGGRGLSGWDTTAPIAIADKDNAQDLCRSTVTVTLPGVNGHSFKAVCAVNLWLRIGYILYIVGPPLPQAEWAQALETTLASIVAIVVGALTLNVGAVIGGVAAIAGAWYKFDEQQKAEDKADQDKGAKIVKGTNLVGGSPTVPSITHRAGPITRNLSQGERAFIAAPPPQKPQESPPAKQQAGLAIGALLLLLLV